MKRNCTLFALVLLAFQLSAQSPRRVHVFHSGSDLPPAAEKFITEQVKMLDQDGIVSLDGRHVKVGVDGRVHRNAILEALNGIGVGEFSLSPALTKSAANGDLDGVSFPVQQDTGNPGTDLQNYLQAKAAWISAHPELYMDPSNTMHY